MTARLGILVLGSRACNELFRAVLHNPVFGLWLGGGPRRPGMYIAYEFREWLEIQLGTTCIGWGGKRHVFSRLRNGDDSFSKAEALGTFGNWAIIARM